MRRALRFALGAALVIGPFALGFFIAPPQIVALPFVPVAVSDCSDGAPAPAPKGERGT